MELKKVPNGCPSSYELAAYCEGRLPEDVLSQIADHLSTCSPCESQYATIESSRGFLPVGSSLLAKPSGDEDFSSEAELQSLLRKAKRLGVAEETLPPTAPRIPPMLGQFRLLEQLGEGGMGTVYKGLDQELDCLVAIKVLRSDLSRRAEFIERFEREKKVLGQLNHANLVRARTAGVEDGLQFIVMDYIEGVDTSLLVRNLGPLGLADACEVVRQAALGLEHLRGLSLVHRDIKPSNLMLASSGDVKILDLGLARVRFDTVSDAELTGSANILGTVDYMAPEQTKVSRDADVRADIYSLGCTLYKLLAGRAPYSGRRYSTPQAKLIAHCTARVPDIRRRRADAPQGLAELVQQMMAKAPEDRPQTPALLAEALAPHAAGANLKELALVATVVCDESQSSQPLARDTSRKLETEPLDMATVTATPAPRRSVSAKPAWIVAAGLLLAVTAGAAIWIRNNGQGAMDDGQGAATTVEWSPDTLDQVAVPLRWYDLLELEPRRLWPAGRRTARVNYDPARQDLMVDEPDVVFLQMGQTASNDYMLQVTLSKTVLAGSAGVYWGLQDVPGKPDTTQCHVLWAACSRDGEGSEVHLTHELIELSRRSPNGRPSMFSLRQQVKEVEFPNESRLEIEVGRGVLRRVVWRGDGHAEVIDLSIPQAAVHTGGFGLVAKHGATLFRDARFKLQRERGVTE